MSADTDNDESGPPHPRETAQLFGHVDAEQLLLEAYRSGHIPHAWLIGGERGIGKATLAYRMARFVFAHPDPTAPAVQKAKSLAVPADHPVARRVASQSHSDLLVLERVVNEKTGKLYTVIRVEDVRRTVSFFGSTAGEGGWRIAILDSVDELAKEGENALLKVLEEPPPRALLLLVSHAPGQVIPTIRSRCRRLVLRPLAEEHVVQAATAALGKTTVTPDIRAAAEAADGSVERALMFLSGSALDLRQRISALLQRLPDVDPRSLHELGDSMAGTEPATLAAFMDTVNTWLSARLNNAASGLPRMAAVAEAYESVNRSAREVEIYNLDRRPFVFAVFGALAVAARG